MPPSPSKPGLWNLALLYHTCSSAAGSLLESEGGEESRLELGNCVLWGWNQSSPPSSLHTHTVNHFCHSHLQPTTQASQRRPRGNRSRTHAKRRSERARRAMEEFTQTCRVIFTHLFIHWTVYLFLAWQMIRLRNYCKEIQTEDGTAFQLLRHISASTSCAHQINQASSFPANEQVWESLVKKSIKLHQDLFISWATSLWIHTSSQTFETNPVFPVFYWNGAV